jgi:hypothetical protein
MLSWTHRLYKSAPIMIQGKAGTNRLIPEVLLTKKNCQINAGIQFINNAISCFSRTSIRPRIQFLDDRCEPRSQKRDRGHPVLRLPGAIFDDSLREQSDELLIE